jgi:hypothetical protein
MPQRGESKRNNMPQSVNAFQGNAGLNKLVAKKISPRISRIRMLIYNYVRAMRRKEIIIVILNLFQDLFVIFKFQIPK